MPQPLKIAAAAQLVEGERKTYLTSRMLSLPLNHRKSPPAPTGSENVVKKTHNYEHPLKGEHAARANAIINLALKQTPPELDVVNVILMLNKSRCLSLK
jgi:hypothetical protein